MNILRLKHCFGVALKYKDSNALDMPPEVRAQLKARADAIVEALPAHREVDREYRWFAAGSCSQQDPLGQYATGAVRLVTESEVEETAYLTALAADGWRPHADVPANGTLYEYRDVHFHGGPTRYARPRETVHG